MAGNKNEVITLQFGNYSNFVGAHFWKLQEVLIDDLQSGNKLNEINHDVLFREGQNIEGGKTYKPRTICVDFKSNITTFTRHLQHSFELETATLENTVKIQGNTASNVDKSPSNHDIMINAGDSPSSPDSQNIESWLDYSTTTFHDKSFHMIEGVHKGDNETFGNFGVGQQYFHSEKFRNDFEDKLHFFIEECDRFQGFQIFSDVHDFFGGLTSSILEDLAEEYNKKFRVCFAMTPGWFKDDSIYLANQRSLNTMLGLSKYTTNGSMVIPLCLRDRFGLKSAPVTLPHLQYKESSMYESSAILACAIDTCTLSRRLINHEDFNLIYEDNRKISTLSMALPIAVSSTYKPGELFKDYQTLARHFTMLTPNVPTHSQTIYDESITMRGIPLHLLNKEEKTKHSKMLSLIQQSSVQQYHPELCVNHILQQPCLIPARFPDIFVPSVTSVGCVIEGYKRPEGNMVEKTSVMTRLQRSQGISEMLGTLVNDVRKMNIRKQSGFFEAGIELEDIESSEEELCTLAHSYNNKYEL